MTTLTNNATEQDNAIKQVVTISNSAINAQVPAHLAGLAPAEYFREFFQWDSAIGHKRSLWNIISSAMGNDLTDFSAQERHEMLALYSLFAGAIDKMKMASLSAEATYRNIHAIGTIPAGSLWAFADGSFILSDEDQHRTLSANEWSESFYQDTEDCK